MIEAAHPDLVRSLRAACAAGSTPSELIQQICDYFGMPADALQFQVILLMKTAFDLSLSEARGVLEAPAFGYRSVDELADFDDRFARVLGCPRRHSNAL